jgi:hypothetical protein
MPKLERKAKRQHRKIAKKRLRKIKRELSKTALITKLVFLLLQASIVLILIASVINLFVRRYADIESSIMHIGLCLAGLVTINIPALIQHKFKIYIPSVLQLVAVLLIYAHFILGEIFRAYDHVPLFDKVLHTLNGLIFALLGFSMVNMLNNNNDEHKKLSPFFVSLFSFCFSLAVSYMWEIFEFSMDSIFKINMQRWKDGIVGTGSGVNAYSQGTGLVDTMIDMIVMMVGGALVSLVGYVSLKTKKNLFGKLLLHDVSDYEAARKKAIEENNTELLSLIEDIYNIEEDDLELEKNIKSDNMEAKDNQNIASNTD